MLHISKFDDNRVAQFSRLMRDAGVAPVLMDVGSAGASPAVWKPIAAGSTLIGFEPDERNPDPSFGADYDKAILVNNVVIPDDKSDVTNFILTKYPSCSSMLEADLEALSSFVFRDFFKPVEIVSLPATSLNRVIKNYDLPGIHWLKIDSQGADLRVLKSVSKKNINNLLAVDIEPGLIDAYKTEDLFPECHTWLKNQGFWMAEFFCQAYAKMRPETMAHLEKRGHTEKELMSKLVKAPTCVEGRYLREVSWLENSAVTEAKKPLWIMSMLFGLCSQQVGYVFDLLYAYENVFEKDDALDHVEKLANNLLAETMA